MVDTSGKGWNPYLAGALTGLLMVSSVWLTGKFFGESLVDPERVASMPYFVRNMPIIDWQWLFVLGILVGAFVSAKLFADFRWEAVPPMWEARFGPDRVKRSAVAFVGGVVAMFGARLAGG